MAYLVHCDGDDTNVLRDVFALIEHATVTITVVDENLSEARCARWGVGLVELRPVNLYALGIDVIYEGVESNIASAHVLQG